MPKKIAAADESFDDLRDLVLESIKSGELDYAISQIDDAVTDRIEVFAKKQAAAKKKTTAEKKEKTVPTPTRAKKESALVPEVNKQYQIDDGVKTHGGKKGKFLRFFKGDIAKSVLDVGEAKPIVVPTSRLVATRAARRPAKKK